MHGSRIKIASKKSRQAASGVKGLIAVLIQAPSSDVNQTQQKRRIISTLFTPK
jgi:hypothetical protein